MPMTSKKAAGVLPGGLFHSDIRSGLRQAAVRTIFTLFGAGLLIVWNTTQ